MKQIKTKNYIKLAQIGGGYPPGVTGNEDYFNDTVDDKNEIKTFQIERNWDIYEKWYNAVESTPVLMPAKGISTIYVKVDYTIDLNVGLGDTPNISINRVINITDPVKRDLTQFELNDAEINEIKNMIAEDNEHSEDRGPDTRDELEGLR
jgi:hypothetical protein